MPRTVTVTDTLTVNPSGYDDANSSYYSLSNVASGYTDSASTTYASIYLNRGSGAETVFYYTFDLSAIPADAVIESVTCAVKVYISSTSSSYITTRQVQMCTGTTLKGSASTVSTSTTAINMSVGTWTASELQNAGIRLYAVRGTSSTSTSRYFRFYGADLTVTYTHDDTYYVITASTNVASATVTPTTQEILAGDSGAVDTYIDNLFNIIASSNNQDVTDSLVPTIPTGSASSVPTAYTLHGTMQSGTSYREAVGEGSDTTNDLSADIFGFNTYVVYDFDFSSLPAEAIIDSVTLTVKAKGSTASLDNPTLQAYYGNIAKGASTELQGSDRVNLYTIEAGAWTRAELQSAKLRISSTGGMGVVDGATWLVEYHMPGFYRYNIENVQSDIAFTVKWRPYHRLDLITTRTANDVERVKELAQLIKTRQATTEEWAEYTRQGTVTQSVTVIPDAYDEANSVHGGLINADTYPIDAAFSDTSSTTSARFRTVTGENAETAIYYNFAVPSLSENAIIKNVTLSVKCGISANPSGVFSNLYVQACNGIVPKGNKSIIETNGAAIRTMAAGNWTRAELENAGFVLYARRGMENVTLTRNFLVYGAELTIEYSLLPPIGAYTATDINRVYSAMNLIAGVLTNAGYPQPYNHKTDWTDEDDFRTPSNMNAYLQAVSDLREVLVVPSTTPEVPENVSNYSQANDVEQILIDVFDLAQSLIGDFIFRQAGTIFMEAGGLLNV